MLLLSQIINGLQLGSIYALVALGYSMVYGIIMLLNFAHGDIIMVGGYVAMLTIAAGVHPLLAVVLAILACMALGVVIDKVAYAPLRSSPRISLLITAIGVSFLLENLAQNIWGANARPFPNSAIIQGSALHIGDVQIGITAIVTIVVSVLSMVVLTFLVQKTKRGKAMRAVSEDMGTAQLMGINVNNTITFTFAVGSAHPLLLHLSPGIPHNGLHAGAEGLCGGGAGRNRLHPRRDDRRLCHWYGGGAGEGRRAFRLDRWGRVRNPHCGAALPAYGPDGPSHDRKSLMNWEGSRLCVKEFKSPCRCGT